MNKINRFIQRYSDSGMWLAGILDVFGILFHHVILIPSLAKLFFLLATIFAGLPILWRAYQGLRFKTVGIECLVSIAMIGALSINELSEAAIVSFLFQFGKWLEQKTMKKTRSAIKDLIKLAPTTALRQIDNEWEEIDVDEVEVDDILLVKTDEQIPVDGIIVSGEGSINEAQITGESIPVWKQVGDTVFGSTYLDSGTIQIKASKVGEDTTFAKIIALVEEAEDAKSQQERFIDRFAKWYTPAVVAFALVVYIVFRNVDTAITVLVLACPGALVIGAPIANVAGIGQGARIGVLLKGGDSVHTFVKTDTFVFDKTGTLTKGQPEVRQVIFYNSDPLFILGLIAGCEQASNHPLGDAIVRYAKQQKIDLVSPTFVNPMKGLGLQAEVLERKVLIGNVRLLQQNGIEVSEKVQEDIESYQQDSLVLAAIDGKVACLFAISDVLKEDAASCIKELRKRGIQHIVMLTGDHQAAANKVADEVGIEEVYAELLPGEKLRMIQDLQRKGHVVTFVGDGMNDSPAIALANTGIAMGSGTEVAIDSSDVVLIKSDLTSVVNAFLLAKKCVLVMYENIAIAILTVLLLLLGLLAGVVHMSIGMLVHEASILVVILNAMRLLGKGEK